jgi:hypothetical protein
MERFSVSGKRVQKREDGEKVDFIFKGGEIQREEDAVLVFQPLECRLLDRRELFVDCCGVDLLKDQQVKQRREGEERTLMFAASRTARHVARV